MGADAGVPGVSAETVVSACGSLVLFLGESVGNAVRRVGVSTLLSEGLRGRGEPASLDNFPDASGAGLDARAGCSAVDDSGVWGAMEVGVVGVVGAMLFMILLSIESPSWGFRSDGMKVERVLS